MALPTVRNIRSWLLRLRHGSKLSLGRNPRFGARVHIAIRPGGRLRIGHEADIRLGAVLDVQSGSIDIGDRCSLNSYAVLYGEGGLTIGNDVRIASHTVIVTADHKFDDRAIPISRQGVRLQGVTIEDDVWIGANCTILDGATLSQGTVVAAGAVVKGTTEPYGIYGGVPARLIKRRGED